MFRSHNNAPTPDTPIDVEINNSQFAVEEPKDEQYSWRDSISSSIFDFSYPWATRLQMWLYDRAELNDNIAQVGFTGNWAFLNAFIPNVLRVAVVSGSNDNLSAVANFGEDNIDSRKPYKFLAKLTEDNCETAVNKVGQEAKMMVDPLRKKLDFRPDQTFEDTFQLFIEQMSAWDEGRTFEDNISLHAVSALFSSIAEMENLQPHHADLARRIGKYVIKPNEFSHELKSLRQDISAGVKEMIESNPELSSLIDGSELKKLLSGNQHFLLLGGNNLSTLIGAGIHYIHTHPELRDKLAQEFSDPTAISFNSARDSELLNSFYLEMTRINGTPILARKVPSESVLKVKDTNGVVKKHILPEGAMLVFPMRRNHFNERFFKNAQTIKPDRFVSTDENQSDVAKMKKHLGPFSAGKRACPAAHNFTPALVMASWIASLQYQFNFTSQIQPMQFNRIDDDWKKDNYLDGKPEKIESRARLRC